MTKTKNRKKAVGIGIKPLGAGIALGVIVITLMLFLGSLLISGEKVPESFSEVIIPIAALFGGVFGGLLAGKQNRGNYVLTGLIVGLMLFGVRMILVLFNDNALMLNSTAVNVLIFLLLGSFFGGLMAGKKRKRHKK